MKQIILSLFFLMIITSSAWSQNNITFCVDVSCIPSPTTVSVFGAFNGWNTGANPMLDDGMNGDLTAGDNIYCTVVSMAAGDQEYKFFTDVSDAENFTEGDPCTVTNSGFTNRVLTVSGDASVSFGFQSCDATCNYVVPANITFCVDVSCIPSPTTVSVFGAFNGWNTGANPMLDDGMNGDLTAGDNIYCAVVAMPAGDQEYKFFTDVSDAENLTEGDPCTVTNGGFTNRVITVSGDASVSFGFQSCDATCNYVVPDDSSITLCVDMDCGPNPFANVALVGTFNGWNNMANPMTDDGMNGDATAGDNTYCTTILLPNGTHEYKFDVDGTQENLTEGDPCTMTTSGFTNRVITVNDADVTETYGWETCFNPSCPRTVTLCVDMNCGPDPFTNVALVGTFNGWNNMANPMADDGMNGDATAGDNVYCATVMFADGMHEYKFDVDGTQETLIAGTPCTMTTGMFTNRIVTVNNMDITETFGWELCTSCLRNVTLCVDMECNPETFIQPNLSGTFNGWGGTANPLSDDGMNGDATAGDNTWCTTVQLPDGDYLYKFNADDWTIQESFNGGLPCTEFDGSFWNRSLTVAGSDISESYGWNTCAMPDCPEVGNVTFCVDVSCITPDPVAISVLGTFNGWNAGANPLADDGMNGDMTAGDDIYCAVVAMPAGNQEFKFFTDVSGQENMTPGDPCTSTINGFTNRVITVDGDASYTYGFQSCDAMCNYTPPANITLCVDMACGPTTFTNVALIGTFNGWNNGANPMADDGMNGDMTAGDNIYCTTVAFDAGDHEYKFDVDGTQESLAPGTSCTITTSGFTNRVLTAAGTDFTESYGWETCTMPTCPADGDVTFCIDVSCLMGISSVSVIGDFNSFDAMANPLADDGMNGDMTAGDGIWCGTVAALSAGNHSYRFATNADEEAFAAGEPCTTDDAGTINRLIEVDGNETVTFGWNSCDMTCKAPSLITFCVDVNCVANVNAAAVVGTFNGWNNMANPMVDDGTNGDMTASDGIWCTTIAFPDGDHEYKFYTDAAGEESFEEGDPCTVTNFGFTNRIVTVAGDATESFGLNSCDANCSASYNITLCVDMSCAPGHTQPHVSGAFNGWNGTANPLSDDGMTGGDMTAGDEVWCTTLNLPNGSYFYKFNADDWAIQEGFTENLECVDDNAGNFDRVLTINGADASYNFGWNTCEEVCPVSRMVTMCVDAGCFDTPPTTASIIGNFNGWNATANPLAEQSPGLFCTSITFFEGNDYEYKYIVDDITEEFTPGDGCTLTTGEFTNRLLSVDNMTPTLVGFGFNSCDINCMAPLDIDLVSFSGYINDKTNVLEWTTATEREHNYFEIQYSTDGIHFETIGKVEGAENSSEATNYSYIHENPTSVMNYYRLNAVDYSGASALSEVVQIIRKGDFVFDIIIRPSIVSNVVNVDFPYPTEQATHIEIFDIQGRIVSELQVPLATMQQTLNTADFENGHYLVRITTGNESIVKRFVKI